MPMYNYACECGKKSEEYVKNIQEVILCPDCNKEMTPQFPTTGKPVIH